MTVGNEESGGFKRITVCYGIIGFVKFLDPYYMLVITKRKKVVEICGHTVYGIAESKMLVIPHPSIQTKVAKSEAEQRYKKLLSMVDLSKNFYFSYTYHLMYSLQKNIGNTERGNIHDNTMFVWNAFLTREIRRILQNSIWTVALVYGFFQQYLVKSLYSLSLLGVQGIMLVQVTQYHISILARKDRVWDERKRRVWDERRVWEERNYQR